ncbi:MAG: ribosomal protein S7 domain-containing protein [Linnemannia gamsii]|nr:MAG: ribosomal protein S7 domain-containing protein [Linnemannia gamsii]
MATLVQHTRRRQGSRQQSLFNTVTRSVANTLLDTIFRLVDSIEMATLALPAGIETDGAVRLFNKWSYDDVEVKDISLIDYIQVKAPVYLPHTAGRFASKRFRKAQCPIVERLTNSLMMHGRNNGKKLMAVRIVKHAFEIIHLLSDQNPIQVLVDAIINTGPREDSTRIGSAGTVRRQAVDVSPLRRVNQAVSLLTIGVSFFTWTIFFFTGTAGTPFDASGILLWIGGMLSVFRPQPTIYSYR